MGLYQINTFTFTFFTFNPLGHTGELDNSRSLINPKETMDAWVATAASAIASHVHYPGAYEGVQVTNLIQKGFCDSSVSEILRCTRYIPRESMHLLV